MTVAGRTWFIIAEPGKSPRQKCCTPGVEAEFTRELMEAWPSAQIIILQGDIHPLGPLPEDAGAWLSTIDRRSMPRIRRYWRRLARQGEQA
jgi:hypothetical protein